MTDSAMRSDGGDSDFEAIRDPCVAGRFYPANADGLRERIESCFLDEYGPGSPQDIEVAGPGPPIALLCPHAAYAFSGPIAAHSFAAFTQTDPPETVVIIGPNHRGVGVEVAVAPHEVWRTPLGGLSVDLDLANTLVAESDLATFDTKTHTGEHALEVQLPFLQYCLGQVSIVPIAVTRPGPTESVRLGEELAAAVRATGRDATVLVSTDLTHYEDHESAVAADEGLVEAIARLDTETIVQAVRNQHSMCGPWSTVAGLTAARELGASPGQRVEYATSGQIMGDRKRVVGYMAAVFL